MPFAEVGAVVAFLAIAAASYFIVKGLSTPDRWLTPPTVATLLVANLVSAMAVMVLIARRVAKRRAAISGLGGQGRMHVRLVACSR